MTNVRAWKREIQMPTHRKKISVHVRRRLWAMSGHVCNFPNCDVSLTEHIPADGSVHTVGHECHINAVSPNGPRPFPDGTNVDPNDYGNLILLCPTHHKTVDDQQLIYTADVLRQWKSDREDQVIRNWEVAFFSYEELDEIITWLAESTDEPATSLSLTQFEEKITRNKLSPSSRRLILIGIGFVSEVESYVNKVARTKPGFANLLLGPLLTQYGKLKSDGLSNDEAFLELIYFACGHSKNPSRWVAGIVLIVYFFERCDLLDS